VRRYAELERSGGSEHERRAKTATMPRHQMMAVTACDVAGPPSSKGRICVDGGCEGDNVLPRPSADSAEGLCIKALQMGMWCCQQWPRLERFASTRRVHFRTGGHSRRGRDPAE
jgi:hypothetical protein